MELLAVAIDAQGAERARPYVDKAGVRFTTLVDEENLLGRLYGFKAIPNGFLIDERGVVRYKQLGGFDIRRSETARVLEHWAKGLNPDETEEAAEAGLGSGHSRSNAQFRNGLKLYRQGKIDEAIAEWRAGVDLDPDNYIIRKQIWAVENPDRFYAGSVDFDWQREQLG